MSVNLARPVNRGPVHSRNRSSASQQHASRLPNILKSGAAGAAVASALMLMVNAPDASASMLQGPARVVDGDTLYIGTEKIRLYGLDAPESKQMCNDRSGRPYACGQVSAQALSLKAENKTVTCQVKNKDQYGRNVASCSVGNEDIGAFMVKNGYAVAYRQYSKEYIPLEDEAHAARVGIWQGDFRVPSDWRKEQKGIPVSSPSLSPSPSVTSSPLSVASSLSSLPSMPSMPCLSPAIKGNISSKGEKIYHVPGGAFYDRVKIDVQDGERMFCSEAEAQAAGWRASNK